MTFECSNNESTKSKKSQHHNDDVDDGTHTLVEEF
ncbi:MAG: hypothetical protein ACI8RD_007467 [Bacillariaceae sp.]|jgi:hypothetical protein